MRFIWSGINLSSVQGTNHQARLLLSKPDWFRISPQFPDRSLSKMTAHSFLSDSTSATTQADCEALTESRTLETICVSSSEPEKICSSSDEFPHKTEFSIDVQRKQTRKSIKGRQKSFAPKHPFRSHIVSTAISDVDENKLPNVYFWSMEKTVSQHFSEQKVFSSIQSNESMEVFFVFIACAEIDDCHRRFSFIRSIRRSLKLYVSETIQDRKNGRDDDCLSTKALRFSFLSEITRRTTTNIEFPHRSDSKQQKCEPRNSEFNHQSNLSALRLCLWVQFILIIQFIGKKSVGRHKIAFSKFSFSTLWVSERSARQARHISSRDRKNSILLLFV